MKHLLMIAMGGALGALARHSVANVVNAVAQHKFPQGHFPYGTITVNVIGSLLIGVMYVLIAERMALHPDWRNVIIVGFLGAFTTFSTFSLETITLLENGMWLTAMSYIIGSLMLCFVAAWLAITVTRMI